MFPFNEISIISAVMSTMALMIIAMALLQALLLYRQHERLQLRSYTHEMIKKDLNWREKIRFILQHVKGKELSRSELNNDPSFWNSIRDVLDYCENISLGIKHGVYDEKTVRDSYATLFVVLYAHLERFIHESRYESNNPETYGAFASIVKEWQNDSKNRRATI